MKYLITLIIFSIFYCNSGYSQQLPVTSQFFDQKFYIIPSLCGMADYEIITITSQKQWIGFKNSPYIFIFGYNGKLGNFDFYNPKGLLNTTRFKTKDRSGIGFQIYSDKAGYLRNSGMNLTYAYHYPINKNRLSLGVSMKISHMYFQNDRLHPNQPNDPLVPEYNESNYFFNSNFGLSYHQLYNFYLGLAVNNILNTIIHTQKDIFIPEYQNQGLYFSGGKYFHFNNFKVIEPYFILSAFYDEGLNTHFGLRYFYRKGSWISLTGNNNFKSIQGNFGILYRKISYCLGYSYYTGPLSKYQKGSIEFSMIARFGDLSRINIY